MASAMVDIRMPMMKRIGRESVKGSQRPGNLGGGKAERRAESAIARRLSSAARQDVRRLR
jgi:hypothetical protein